MALLEMGPIEKFLFQTLVDSSNQECKGSSEEK